MSSSNKSIWIVIAVSAVLGIIIAIYVARVIGERSDRRLITAQVDEWAQGWASTRACLIGDEPAFASGSHSFLMAQASHPDQYERLKSCEQYLRKVVRPGDESTGNDTIEKSWENLRDATKKLVNAYALLIDPSSLRPLAVRRARMAEAIDGLDQAYAKLRQDSKLEPAPMPAGTGAPVELGQGTVVKAQDTPIPMDQADLFGDTLLVQGEIAGVTTLAVVRGPDAVETYPIGVQAMRAADATPWGTWFTNAAGGNLEMRTGALDPGGSPQDAGVVVVTARPGEDIQARFALGNALGNTQGNTGTRAILYQPMETSDLGPMYKGLHLVRSTDGGATWSQPVLLADNLSLIRADDDPGRRRFDLVWRDSQQGAVRWLPLRADRLDPLPQPRRLFEVAPGDSTELRKCLGEHAAWWSRAGAELVHVAGDSHKGMTPARPVENVPPGSDLVRCNDDLAVLSVISHDTDTLSLHTCDARACKQVMTVAVPDRSYEIGLGAKHGPMVVTWTAPLLMLWRPGAEPVALLAPADQSLHSIVEWQGTLTFIMRHEQTVRLAPVNLPAIQPAARPTAP
jgi:hypothetical protein